LNPSNCCIASPTPSRPEFVGIFGTETPHAYLDDAYERIAHEARASTATCPP
jgi:hypothetical protein